MSAERQGGPLLPRTSLAPACADAALLHVRRPALGRVRSVRSGMCARACVRAAGGFQYATRGRVNTSAHPGRLSKQEHLCGGTLSPGNRHWYSGGIAGRVAETRQGAAAFAVGSGAVVVWGG